MVTLTFLQSYNNPLYFGKFNAQWTHAHATRRHTHPNVHNQVCCGGLYTVHGKLDIHVLHVALAACRGAMKFGFTFDFMLTN